MKLGYSSPSGSSLNQGGSGHRAKLDVGSQESHAMAEKENGKARSPGIAGQLQKLLCQREEAMLHIDKQFFNNYRCNFWSIFAF